MGKNHLESGIKMQKSIINYRADIDGLRAFAIIFVIAFHVSPTFFPGGFAGVDMFFVISGYLITSGILKQLHNNSFSIKEFYIRRVNRIFPPLLIVMASVTLIGWFFLLPSEFKDLGHHITSGSLFISNISYFLEVGYFNTAAELKPLLHLWSLGIEEQFYIVLPLIIIFFLKKNASLQNVFLILIFISLSICMLRVGRHTSETFFLLHTRFWELIVGSYLASVEQSGKFERLLKDKSRYFSIAGLTLMALFPLVLHGNLKFPGAWALLPTVGCALLIASGSSSFVGKFVLSNKLLTSIGIISYPLYLWHWPLLSFGEIVLRENFNLFYRLIAIFCALILSIATYKLLETPIKKINSRSVLAHVLLILILGVGLVGRATKKEIFVPLSAQLGDSILKISRATGDWDYPGRLKVERYIDGLKLYSQGSGSESILFVGDSHIEQLYPRAEKLVKSTSTKHKILFLAHQGCAPIPELHDGTERTKLCPELVKKALSFAKDSSVNTVVLGASWVKIFDSSTSHYIGKDPKSTVMYGSLAYRKALNSLENEISEIIRRKKRVILIGPSPSSPKFSPLNLVKRSFSMNPISIQISSVPVEEIYKSHSKYNDDLSVVAQKSGAIFINTINYLCSNQICGVVDNNGNPFYKDATHFRPFYSSKYAKYVDIAFSN